MRVMVRELRAGPGRAGPGRAGPGRAGQGRAGQGRAGQGRAGQGRAGQREDEQAGGRPGRQTSKINFRKKKNHKSYLTPRPKLSTAPLKKYSLQFTLSHRPGYKSNITTKVPIPIIAPPSEVASNSI